MENLNLLYEHNNIYAGVFNEWRVKRALKLKEHFGADWFKGKKILELGCALGNIGFYFKSLGADVEFSDARKEILYDVKRKDKSITALLIDQDKPWNLNKKYDLIIHFGILYNLDNWHQDLIASIKHCEYLALESATSKFNDDIEFKIKDYEYTHEYHGPFNKVGTLVSAQKIENTFKENNCKFVRLDHKSLNTDGFIYDWQETNQSSQCQKNMIINHWADKKYCGGRRFWIAKNKV